MSDLDSRFINIVNSPTGLGVDRPRVSTLLISKDQGTLQVLANLPHGYSFKPTTANDRDKLTAWLAGLEYPTATEK